MRRVGLEPRWRVHYLVRGEETRIKPLSFRFSVVNGVGALENGVRRQID